jgi:glycosyltransferase involved in cell wall biosynthesis
VDRTYGWAPVTGEPGFPRRTLLLGRDPEEVPRAELEALLDTCLAQGPQPSAVAVPGWASPGARALLRWAVRHGIPAILMSDSTEADAPRHWPKELAKRQLLRFFRAAFVAGAPQARYLEGLGFASERIFRGYDVVDNAHFAAGAKRAAGRREPFFLASGRFVPKKNFARLLEAYALYRGLAGPMAWGLVLMGDGELRPALESLRTRFGLDGHVAFPGFRQYAELPAWYGRAGAFVLPSTSEQWGLVVNEAMAAGLPVLVSRRCGCAEDLVREGRNGFTFDPLDVPGLATLLRRTAHGGLDLAGMGEAGRMTVADWGLERFVTGLAAAVAAATRPEPGPRPGLLGRGLLLGLARP